MKTYLIILALLLTGCNSAGQDAPEKVILRLTPEEVRLSSENSTEVVFYSTHSWTASSDKAWCACTPASGTDGSVNVVINATPNATGAERTAEITFTASGSTIKLKVVQDAAEISEYVPAGYVPVWNDEFARGKMPNMDKWWYETGGGGWGNNELQTYIAGNSGTDTCARITGGILNIVAKKKGTEVLSVRVNTKENWMYGYFEARLKLPGGKGTWPAFWMMPANSTVWPDDGEIDIMEEVGYRPGWVSSAVHCKAYYHSIGTQKTGEQYVATAESDFHVYAVEWTSDYIRGMVDGKEHFKFTNDKQGNKNTWPFNAPFYLKLNLAWGGNWGGAQGVDESKLPATYQIDYVRVYQKP